MLTQWRAGLRISEALGLEVGDLDFAGDGACTQVVEYKQS